MKGATEWITESETIAEEVSFKLDDLQGLVDCVELPDELLAADALADADKRFADSFGEWTWYLSSNDLFLALEQACDEQGLLLPWDMRGVRLATLPAPMLAKLHVYFERCPGHVRGLLTHWVFWIVRFERIARCGGPAWRPQPPAPVA